MNSKKTKQSIAIAIVFILILAAVGAYLFISEINEEKDEDTEDMLALAEGVKLITETYNFSNLQIEELNQLTHVSVEGTDFYSRGDGRPVLPVKLTTLELPFGTKILKIEYSYKEPETIDIYKKISYGSCSALTEEDEDIYTSSNSYPEGFVTYHTGGGLSDNEHKTMLNIRVYPVIYRPADNQIDYTEQVQVKVYYKEPETPLIVDANQYDLLIISPAEFANNLQPLINHKKENRIRTKLITTDEIYDEFEGVDEAEQIKYCIKDSIEKYGIDTVLLVGGRDGQSANWLIPPRYSHVLIREGTQENQEPEFLSDLYFADIYDSEGEFSSWDTDGNDVFAEYDDGIIDEMDLYPDVALGRLPCRNKREVTTIVNKIITYENMNLEEESWFKRIILVANDHWPDEDNTNEGALIMEEAKRIMSGFDSVDLYESTKANPLKIRDIQKPLNQGAGFVYFSGHGSSKAWGIHYSPDADGWGPSILGTKITLLSFYKPIYMKLLRNKEKLPITVVGGCHNGQFDVTLFNGGTSCWAWELTKQKRGGSIATIANTGLGTHALGDRDRNEVNEYLEDLDGWLELKFFELYAKEDVNVLGEMHQEAMTQYLNRFLGNNDEMDIKMVQQWELFGDPSLEIS